MPAMTEIHPASLRPSAIPDIYSQDDEVSTSHQPIVPTDYDELSPLDALAAQGRLLNKRLIQQGPKRSEPPNRTTDGLDESIPPKFGITEVFESGKTQGFQRRNRLPETRRPTGTETSERARSPADSLSLAALTLLSPSRSTSPPGLTDLARSESQSSSVLSLSTSSDGSDTPTETYLTSRIYQRPPKADPPRLRPIIKTQHLSGPRSPSQSPSTSANRTPIDMPSLPRPFSPEASKTLDRPRLPPVQPRSDKSNNGRTPSINFSRPYSSRSSAYSEASSVYETDYFSPQKVSPSALSADDHLSVPTSGTESVGSSPGLAEEDYKRLPRGRRKSRPILDTGIFFQPTSIKRTPSAHRWPQTPITPTNETENKFFPSPKESKESSPTQTLSAHSSIDLSKIPPPPPIPRPSTSGSGLELPRTRETRSHSHSDVRRPSTSFPPKSQGYPDSRSTLHHPRESNSTQIVNRTRSTTISVTPAPTFSILSMSPEEHLNLGIKFHEQDFLPQSTHHFKLAAEGGSATGMLFYSLSLRHGWGCAPNPEKAVEWLHLAAECASAEVDENGRPLDGGTSDGLTKTEESKKRRATLALAVYELGQSYMHGWGVQKDKHLALRCYEISANFGDSDGQW